MNDSIVDFECIPQGQWDRNRGGEIRPPVCFRTWYSSLHGCEGQKHQHGHNTLNLETFEGVSHHCDHKPFRLWSNAVRGHTSIVVSTNRH